jgi:hypothetical protein
MNSVCKVTQCAAIILMLFSSAPAVAGMVCFQTSCGNPYCSRPYRLMAQQNCRLPSGTVLSRARCCMFTRDEKQGSTTSDKGYTVARSHKCWIACMRGREQTKANRSLCSARCK